VGASGSQAWSSWGQLGRREEGGGKFAEEVNMLNLIV